MGHAFWAIVTYIIILLFFVFSMIESNVDSKLNSVFSFTLLIVALLVLPYRGFGLDFENYRVFYEQTIINPNLEPAYILLMHIFRMLDAPFEVFYFGVYLFSICLFAYSFSKMGNSIKLWFFFIVLYYFTYFDVTRAFISSAVLMVSLRLICDRKYFLFFLSVIIGAFTHYSFLIVVPFYFLLKIKITRITLFVFMLIAFAIGSVLKYLLYPYYEAAIFNGTNLQFFHNGLRYIFAKAGEKESYLNPVHAFLWYSINLYIPFLSSIFAIIFCSSKFKVQTRFIQFLKAFNCYGVVLFVLFCSLGSLVMAARLSLLFSVGLPVLIIIYCFGIRDDYRNLMPSTRYIFVSILMILLSLFPFAYIAHVYQPGALLYYGKLF